MNNIDYYEIEVLGEVNVKRFSKFKINKITLNDGNTQLYGYFDQTALFSMLKTIRDLHLKILKLKLIKI